MITASMAGVILGGFAFTQALAIEAGSPDMLCPSLDLATKAVHSRLGALETEQLGWRARYTAGHTPSSGEGDFIRLELFDPNGRLRMSRDLPNSGESCATMAQTMAIVLDGYFTNPASTDNAESESASDAAGQSPAPSVPQRPAPPDSPHAVEPKVDSRPWRHQLGVGVYQSVASTDRGLTFSYAASSCAHRIFGLMVSWPLNQQTEAVEGGTVAMSAVRGRLWYGFEQRADHYALSLAPALVVGVDVAQGRALEANQKHERVILALGLLGGATLFPYRTLGIGIQSGLDLTSHLLTRRFVVAGPNPGSGTEVHSPRWWNAFVGITATVALSE